MKKLNSAAFDLENRRLEHEGTRSYCGIQRNHEKKQEPVRERAVMPVAGGLHEGDYILYNYMDDPMGCGERATAVVAKVTKRFIVVDRMERKGFSIRTSILRSDLQVGIVLAKKLHAAAYSSDYCFEELDVYRWEEDEECAEECVMA